MTCALTCLYCSFLSLARLAVSFAETGDLIHPRHERREPGLSDLPGLPGADGLPELPGADSLPSADTLPALPGTDELPALPGSDALPGLPFSAAMDLDADSDDLDSDDDWSAVEAELSAYQEAQNHGEDVDDEKFALLAECYAAEQQAMIARRDLRALKDGARSGAKRRQGRARPGWARQDKATTRAPGGNMCNTFTARRGQARLGSARRGEARQG